jgi:hypothetical protein
LQKFPDDPPDDLQFARDRLKYLQEEPERRAAEEKARAADEEAARNRPSFRGIRFGVDVREQIPECAKKFLPVGGTSGGLQVYDDEDTMRQTCWERHVACVDGSALLRTAVACSDPWIVVFADNLNGMLPLAAFVEQVNGKLALLSFGKSSPATQAAAEAKAASLSAENAKRHADEDFAIQRSQGATHQELVALAQAQDATQMLALLARRIQLHIKLLRRFNNFSVRSFPDAEALFRAKYGRPALSNDEPWQSKGGVQAKSLLRVWKWKGLTIRLKSIDEDVDSGSLIVATDEYIESSEKQRLERLKRGLGNL